MKPNRVVLASVITALGSLSAAAQDGGALPPGPPAYTLTEIVRLGGPLMYVLGGLSVIGLALVIYLAVTLRAAAVVPRALREDLADALDAGRVEEARALCRRDRSAFAAVAGAAVGFWERAKTPDTGLLKELVEGEGGRQAAQIQGQVQYLLDVAVIAPMVGLLGTVLGMLQAFNAVALDIAKARPMVLADGVSKALITTAAGLMVGIPAMVAYAFFRGRGAQLISHLEAAAADLVLRLPKKDRPR